jgi:hypothetical protein
MSKDLGGEIIFPKIKIVNFKLDYKSKELLQEILELELSGVFPNITIAPRILVSLPASAASGKCAFNMLKQVKIYSRSTM